MPILDFLFLIKKIVDKLKLDDETQDFRRPTQYVILDAESESEVCFWKFSKFETLSAKNGWFFFKFNIQENETQDIGSPPSR